MASLNHEKGVYFIHKSIQEYLAGNFLKEELTSKKDESTNSLLNLDSVEKIQEMFEVLQFSAQLSEEAAREIMIHLGTKSGLKEFTFDNETPSQEELSREQTDFINLCKELFFNRSAETRKNLFPTFLSSLGGVLVINVEQLNVIVQEKLVQTTETPSYVFFLKEYDDYKEQEYFSNLKILSQQLNTVIVSSAGEKKASEFLSNLTWRSIDEFFLKKEENNAHLYLAKIIKKENEDEDIPFPCDIIKALISKQETTKKTNMNGDESSEESSSSCCSKRHGLSRVRRIHADEVNRTEVELMSEMMPFITAPHVIWVRGEPFIVHDAEVTESLLRSIQVTHKLKKLALRDINVRSSPAVEFINSLCKKAPNLVELDMSDNRLLGAGVDSLINYLSCAPHLKHLWLEDVKMTPQQVKDLSSTIKQHGNITTLWSFNHMPNGDPRPKDRPLFPIILPWPYPELFPDSSSELKDEQEQEVCSLTEIQDLPQLEHSSPNKGLNPPCSPSKALGEPDSFPEIDEARRKKKKRKREKAEQRTEAGDEESPRKRRKRKKHKIHGMTEGVEGTSRKRKKRKKHKEHRRDKGGEESTRKGKTRKKYKEGRVTEQGDEESPRKRKKRKQHKAHRVTEGDEEPRRKRSKRE